MDKSHPRFADQFEPIENEDLSYKKTGIPTLEGEFLLAQIQKHGYTNTLEIGCALGISSLYICEALVQAEQRSHTIIDPNQNTQWQGIGLRNLTRRGFDFFTLIEKPSEIALPQLLQEQRIFDFAFIDGWHTFDHTLLDFFYLNRMVRVGGMIVFDDVRYPAVAKVLRYTAQYPGYQIVEDDTAFKPAGKKMRLLQGALATWRHIGYLFPTSLRPIFFSASLCSRHPVFNLLLHRPRWVALQKTAEDSRNFDWFQDF